MQIKPISLISFQKCIKIPLKDKSMGDRRMSFTPMDKIFCIAESNAATVYITKDVFILSSDDKIKESLEKSNIDFQEVDSID